MPHVPEVVASADRCIVMKPLAQSFGRVTGQYGPFARLHHAEQLVDTLKAAHGAGLVHRDVRPANILQASDSEVLLVDWYAAAPAGVPVPWEGTLRCASDRQLGQLAGGADELVPTPADDMSSLVRPCISW